LHGAEGYADIGPIAALARRCPVVMTVHDLWLVTGHCGYPLECGRWQTGCGNCPDLQRFPPIPHDATRWNWRRKQWAFRSADVHLIVPSSWVAEQLQQSPILRHLPATVVYSPIDTSYFHPTDRRAAREALGLPQDRKIVLLTAQSLSNVYKGVQEGVQALNRINDDRLFVVAIGRDAEAVLKECRAPGVAIAYQSEQSALADYYRAADVFLMPSRCETFGMVAAEALACGTPVVAFAAGGLTDVLGNDAGGLLVPPGDVPALAAATERLLSQPDLHENLGRIGAARAAREFSLAQHTRRCLDVYSRLIAARATSQN
ncbi:MAG: glycosyltransferase, partial [Planctomycetaceae bacterium]|nr:glycosyltransferase [Planctomycetaceae bacterium]